jgi:ribosomal-protein-alanine N-acetyltransferase
MVFLRSSIGQDAGPIVRSRRLLLRPPQMFDYPAWAEVRQMSREHLTPWEPAWARDELTRAAFRRRVRHYQREIRDDLGYAFLIIGEADEVLHGGLTLSNVRRGVTQAATLGYWLGVRSTGRGYMREAVTAICGFAFERLRLHRVEAACLPHNQASVAVLEACGFVHEGLARRYLKIAGAWQDHKLYARLSDDPPVPGEGRP